MADIEKVKQALRCCKSCLKSHCEECPHNGKGDTFDCTADLANDALSVIEGLQANIERLKKNIKMKNARLKIMKADKEYWRNMWLATLDENDD